jgi:cystathionine beta-lyase family protein involved in aluminum resistance
MNQMEHTEETTIYEQLGISDRVLAFAEPILQGLRDRFDEIDAIAEVNQLRVVKAMQDAHIGEANLSGTTGYGYDDIGRDGLEEVYANYFHTEDALVRPQITCGTHALATALFGNLRTGQILLSVAGKPYDTLEEVIGIRPSRGSLAEYGIGYRQIDLLSDDSFDRETIRKVLTEDTEKKIHVVTIQRSKGYQARRTFSVDQIGDCIQFMKAIRPDCIYMVDNCYGEFTETKEPSDEGADMVVGSLIKNPGGGLAPCGGYVVGTKECVANAAVRLTSPGLGKEVGASLSVLPRFYQGFFLGPTVTAAAEKGAVFAASCYEALGFDVIPRGDEIRHDIIQAITFHKPEGVIAFCQGIQAASPVDSFVACEPAPMPGYDSDVIMAAGAFVSGSSIELSADGPIREPYTVFFQGGLTWPHAKFGILKTLQNMLDRGLADFPERS